MGAGIARSAQVMRRRVGVALQRSPQPVIDLAVAAFGRVGLARYAEVLKPSTVPHAVWVRVPDGGRSATFQLLSVDGRDLIARSIWEGGWQGFERPLPDVFWALAAAAGPSLIVDVGANSGFYSLVAQAANRAAAVHAFEPFPPAVDVLDANLALNRSQRIRRFDRAVSDAVGTATLYIPLQGHGLVETSCSLRPDFKPEHSGTVDVPVTTIDAHVAAYWPGRVGLIKIDVEGHENEVLRGATGTIERDRPPIVLEILDQIDTDDTNAMLQKLDYVAYTFEDGKLVPEEEVRCVYRPEAWNHVALPRESPLPAGLIRLL